MEKIDDLRNYYREAAAEVDRETGIGKSYAKPNIIMHASICQEINALYERKNNDYGSAIEKGITELGWCYLYSQLWNKLQRFINLTSGKATQMVNDESLEDTLIDLANYAIEGARVLRSMRPTEEVAVNEFEETKR